MVKRGLGDKQISDFKTATQKILKVLSNGEWYTYSELRDKTGISTATLTKHLEKLAKGIVERHVDIESGKYPPPVCYRIRPIFSSAAQSWRNFLTEEITKDAEYTVKEMKRPEINIAYLNQHIALQVLENLDAYFLSGQNDVAFNQWLEYLVLSVYRESVLSLKDKLKELASEGENMTVLLSRSKQRFHLEEALRQNDFANPIVLRRKET